MNDANRSGPDPIDALSCRIIPCSAWKSSAKSVRIADGFPDFVPDGCRDHESVEKAGLFRTCRSRWSIELRCAPMRGVSDSQPGVGVFENSPSTLPRQRGTTIASTSPVGLPLAEPITSSKMHSEGYPACSRVAGWEDETCSSIVPITSCLRNRASGRSECPRSRSGTLAAIPAKSSHNRPGSRSQNRALPVAEVLWRAP